MKTYNFYIDRKVTVWEREKFEIKAKNKKTAIKMAKNQIENPDYDTSLYTEILFETVEELPVENNEGYSTIELYDNDTNKLLATNEKRKRYINK